MTDSIALTETVNTTIVQNIVEKLQASYIFLDIAEQISLRLQTRLAAGEYATITDAELLAQTLTSHIQEINHDKHLRVRWYAEPLPEQEGALHHNPDWLADFQQQAELENYGLYKVERLPGNVGYLDIRVFSVPSLGGDVAAAAMTFLANTRALMIDLRQCRGGAPDMIAFLSTYLFDSAPERLSDLYWREDNFTRQYWTLPFVPGRRFGNKPVYILTSQTTFSAAEAFAYDLQALKRATLIGETTRGGAHPGTMYRLHPHLDVFIPNGRAINPITGTNWEGSGVVPDVAVTQTEAYQVAYRMALTSVIDGLSEATSNPLNQLKEEAQTALRNLDAPSETAQAELSGRNPAV